MQGLLQGLPVPLPARLLPGQEGGLLPGQEGRLLPGKEGRLLPGQEGRLLPGVPVPLPARLLQGGEASARPGGEASARRLHSLVLQEERVRKGPFTAAGCRAWGPLRQAGRISARRAGGPMAVEPWRAGGRGGPVGVDRWRIWARLTGGEDADYAHAAAGTPSHAAGWQRSLTAQLMADRARDRAARPTYGAVLLRGVSGRRWESS